MATTGTANVPQRWYTRHTPRWLREVVLVGLIYVAYEFSRGLQNGAVHIATRNGWDILKWERSLDIAPEHLFTKALLSITPLTVAAAYFYSTMHYIITPVVLIWMYRQHGSHYRTARTALAISTIMGLVVFYLVPTAPPRLLAGAGVPDALFDVRNWGWWGGDGSVPRGLGGLTNQFAAMPSLHVGWALWCGFLLFRYSRHTWIRVLAILYPLTTTFVVLATGNHYLLDALAGALVMALGAGGAVLVKFLERRIVEARARRHSTPVMPAADARDRSRDTAAAGPGASVSSGAAIAAHAAVDSDKPVSPANGTHPSTNGTHPSTNGTHPASTNGTHPPPAGDRTSGSDSRSCGLGARH